MKAQWHLSIIIIFFGLMTLIKCYQQSHLTPYFQQHHVLVMPHFKEKHKQLSSSELELLKLWESMLTGRTRPVSKDIKGPFKTLGLNHLFTPSGFHLSAIMLPWMKLITAKKWQITALVIVGLFIFSLSGQGALKRMALIKLNQKFLGQKEGFILALFIDVLFGNFTSSPMGFCYSFLFLGIIYSGKKPLFVWFFFCQCLISFLNNEMISPLLLIFSPLLNMIFALILPLLFLLTIPLWNWQLYLGLKMLSIAQKLVVLCASFCTFFPTWEINTWSLLCLGLFYFKKKKSLLLAISLFSSQLNFKPVQTTSLTRYDFVPQGDIQKIISNEKYDYVYWQNGKCRRDLINGIWWDKCSPLRKSTYKKIKKLSSL